MARADVGAAKAVARHQHHAADAGGGAGAAGFRHAVNAERRLLGRTGELFEAFDRGQLRVDEVEIGNVAREQLAVGESRERVLGRNPRHRDRARGQLDRTVALGVVAGDHGLTLADQHAQAHVVALGALACFDRAVAHLDGERDPAHRDRIGRIRSRVAGGGDEAFGERDERRLVEEG